MRVIRDTETQEFTDGDGDRLILLKEVRMRDLEASAEVEHAESLETMRELGMDPSEAFKKAAETSVEEQEAARERNRVRPKSPKVRRLRLKAIVMGMTLAGKEVQRSTIMQVYDEMPRESAAWVDACVAEIWAKAEPSEDTKNGQGVSAGTA